jgi:hypothetical protein
MKKIKKNTCFSKFCKAMLAVALIIGLFLGWLIFNAKIRSIERHIEVTFVSPHQALVFWKSNSQSLGYIKSGEHKYWRRTKTYQTSSEPGDVHAVLLENVPIEGLYISVHNDNDSVHYFPDIIEIRYHPESMENEL